MMMGRRLTHANRAFVDISPNVVQLLCFMWRTHLRGYTRRLRAQNVVSALVVVADTHQHEPRSTHTFACFLFCYFLTFWQERCSVGTCSSPVLWAFTGPADQTAAHTAWLSSRTRLFRTLAATRNTRAVDPGLTSIPIASGCCLGGQQPTCR